MKTFALFVMSLVVASADVVLDGSCPDIRPVANFDMSAYQGTWYEIKRLSVATEAHAECSIIDYKLVKGILKVNHTHVVDDVRKSIWGVLTRAYESDGFGELYLNTVIADSVRIIPYWVVSTDYTNYAIVYSCKDFKKSDLHAVYLFVLSRNKTLSEGASVIVKNFLKDHSRDFPESKFVVPDTSDEVCNARKTSVYTVPFDY